MPRRGENIYKRKDGRWEGRVKTPSSNGKTVYKYIYGKTYNSVKEKMFTFKEHIRDLPEKKTSDKTVRMLFSEWFSAIELTVKPSTFYNYKMKAEKHIIPEFGNFRPDSLETAMINDFISKKISAGLSSGYVNDIIAVFNTMMKYVNRLYGIKNIVELAAVPREKDKELFLLSAKQQKALYKTLSNEINGTSLCIMLSLFTGLRIGEVCGLTWNDIDMDNKTIQISKTVQRIYNSSTASGKLVIDEPKSKSSRRTIPVPAFLFELLKDNKGEATAYILSGTDRITEPRTLQRRFKSLLKKAELPYVNYHCLRHMFATNCIQTGFDIKTLSEILGHSSVEITLKRYVHSSMERKIECMNLLNPAV